MVWKSLDKIDNHLGIKHSCSRPQNIFETPLNVINRTASTNVDIVVVVVVVIIIIVVVIVVVVIVVNVDVVDNVDHSREGGSEKAEETKDVEGVRFAGLARSGPVQTRFAEEVGESFRAEITSRKTFS
jgi:hypothetical protein